MRFLFPPSFAGWRYLGCTIAALGVAALVSSASAQSANQNSNSNEQSEHQAGHQVYMHARCFACHGEYGFGGVGPRFREDRFLGVKDYVVGQILIGRGVMPSFADSLDNQQIAAVATYIRTSWGNNFGAVSPSDVAKVRNQIKVHPPQGPHVSATSNQPPGVPVQPHTPMPPGSALPPSSKK